MANFIPDQTAGYCADRGTANATAGSVEAVSDAARRGAGSRAFVRFGTVLALVMALVMTASVGVAIVVVVIPIVIVG